MTTIPDRVKAVTCGAIDDPSIIKTILSIIPTTLPTQRPTNPWQPGPPDAPTNRWATLERMAEVWEKDIDRKIKKQEDTSDKKKAAWKNLNGLQCQTILLASTTDSQDLETTPTDTMLSILGNRSGPRAKELLHHLLQITGGCIVDLDDGFCSALKNGRLLSQPNQQHIQNYLGTLQCYALTPPTMHDSQNKPPTASFQPMTYLP